MVYSIDIDKPVLEFEASGTLTDTFKVKIDGGYKGTGYRYKTYGGEWFDVFQGAGNTFTVVLKENFNISDRDGYIVFHHNCIRGDAGERTVHIVQYGVKCDIEVYPDKIDDFNSDEFEEDRREIGVNVTGGREKFYVQSVRQFNAEGKLRPYDNGIKVGKADDAKLYIVNYGQVFKENGCHYEVTVAHVDDRTKARTITVSYNGHAYIE